jgi:hypothetical protein
MACMCMAIGKFEKNFVKNQIKRNSQIKIKSTIIQEVFREFILLLLCVKLIRKIFEINFYNSKQNIYFY